MSASDSSASSADILFVTRKWAPATGGMETYCLRLTEELAKRHTLDIVALPGRASGMPPGTASLLCFPFTVIKRLMQRKSPAKVMHLGDMAIWPLGLLASHRTGLVISAHGTDVAYHRRAGFRGKLYGAYMRLGARMLSRAKIIANSQATKGVLAETGWQTEAVVPLATDIAPTSSYSGHDRSILFAGRLVKRKGCSWFIANVMPLLDERITLEVAGTQWDESETALLDHPRVDFLGPKSQQELAQLYAKAMCVVVPNIDVPSGEYEGFGLVAPEAASSGGVVLAAKSGGLVDAVRPDETGFLLESGDPRVWADKISEISAWDEAQRATFTSNASKTARSFYSWQRVANETAAVYLRAGGYE